MTDPHSEQVARVAAELFRRRLREVFVWEDEITRTWATVTNDPARLAQAHLDAHEIINIVHGSAEGQPGAVAERLSALVGDLSRAVEPAEALPSAAAIAGVVGPLADAVSCLSLILRMVDGRLPHTVDVDGSSDPEDITEALVRGTRAINEAHAGLTTAGDRLTYAASMIRWLSAQAAPGQGEQS